MAEESKSLARLLVQRATRRGREAARGAMGALVQRSQQATGELLSGVVSARIEGLADVAAARLLELDEAASRLAMFVERVTLAVGRDAVMPVLLRRNLVLDGTMLRVLEPLLQGGDQVELDATTRTRALSTLVLLLSDLSALLDPDAPVATDVHELVSRPDADVLEPLAPLLSGERAPAETDRFIMMSYLLFLQSYLLRSVAGMTATAVRAQGQRLALLGPGADEGERR